MKRLILSALVAFTLAGPAFAQDAAKSEATLFPGSIDLPIVDGARVPDDCLYPASLRDSHYDLACVVLPAGERSAEIGAQYLGLLGQRGYRQGNAIIGGFTAVKDETNGCEQVVDIFPSAYPPAQQENAQNFVIWFARERQQRCGAQTQPQ